MLLPEVKMHYGKLKFLIGGEWVDSTSANIEPDVNPATGEVIAEFPQATREEATAAVEAAHKAVQTWKNVPLRERAYMLFTMHNKFREKTDMLCRVLVQDHGRTIEEARGTLARVLENIESACSAAYGLVKENAGIMNLASGIDEYLFWEPLGAFLIVTPGNIPMHAWSSFVPYALAAGCTVVISPSRQVPMELDYQPTPEGRRAERRDLTSSRSLTFFLFYGDPASLGKLQSQTRFREHDIIERHQQNEIRGVFTHLKEIELSEVETVPFIAS